MMDFNKAYEDYNTAIKLGGKGHLNYVNNRGWANLKRGEISLACEDFSYAAERGHEKSKDNLKNYCDEWKEQNNKD